MQIFIDIYIKIQIDRYIQSTQTSKLGFHDNLYNIYIFNKFNYDNNFCINFSQILCCCEISPEHFLQKTSFSHGKTLLFPASAQHTGKTHWCVLLSASSPVFLPGKGEVKLKLSIIKSLCRIVAMMPLILLVNISSISICLIFPLSSKIHTLQLFGVHT